MNESQNKRLSRDFVIRSILKLFDEVETQKKWGAVQISWQNGIIKTIKKEETIISENANAAR